MPDTRPHYFIGVPIPEGIANPIYRVAKNEPVLTFQNGCTRLTIILR